MWFFVLGGLIAFTGKPVSSSCPVEIRPSEAVVKFGDPLIANCSSSSNQTASMGWEVSAGGTGLLYGYTSIALNITSVTDWKIKPQCFINLNDGYQCFHELPVTVYRMPDSVSLAQPHETVMLEGQEYNVQCSIINVAPVRNLSVQWYKGNKVFHVDNAFDETPLPVNKISVTNHVAHRDDDGAQIWCEAKLLQDLPPVRSESQKMIVLYAPVFHEPENKTVEIGGRSKMTLNCTAAGNPAPVYSWRFPHAIQGTKDENENQPVLTPSFELPGTYTCTARNAQGSRTKYFTVTQAKRNYTTIAALIGVFASLGALLFIVGLLTVTPQGTFSFSNTGYLPGQATSGPV